MVTRKILWLSILLNGNNNIYILFGFAIITILLSFVTRLTIVTNIQIIALLDFE